MEWVILFLFLALALLLTPASQGTKTHALLGWLVTGDHKKSPQDRQDYSNAKIPVGWVLGLVHGKKYHQQDQANK